jgi:hypothetical protein
VQVVIAYYIIPAERMRQQVRNGMTRLALSSRSLAHTRDHESNFEEDSRDRASSLPSSYMHSRSLARYVTPSGGWRSLRRLALGSRLQEMLPEPSKTVQSEKCAKNPTVNLCSGVCGGISEQEEARLLAPGYGLTKPLVIMCRCAIWSKTRHTVAERRTTGKRTFRKSGRGEMVSKGAGTNWGLSYRLTKR